MGFAGMILRLPEGRWAAFCSSVRLVCWRVQPILLEQDKGIRLAIQSIRQFGNRSIMAADFGAVLQQLQRHSREFLMISAE